MVCLVVAESRLWLSQGSGIYPRSNLRYMLVRFWLVLFVSWFGWMRVEFGLGGGRGNGDKKWSKQLSSLQIEIRLSTLGIKIHQISGS